MARGHRLYPPYQSAWNSQPVGAGDQNAQRLCYTRSHHYSQHYQPTTRPAGRYNYWRRRSPPDLLDQMFASARASLTALCLSVRAIDGHPVNASRGLRDAATSQATACIDWIKAISTASNDVSDQSEGQLGNIACGCMVVSPNEASQKHSTQFRSSIDGDPLYNVDVPRVNPLTPPLQSNCEEKDLVVVEEASSSTSLCKVADTTPIRDAKLKSCSSLLDKPQVDVVVLNASPYADKDKPTNQWFGTSQLRRRSTSARIKESNSLIVESICSHMKALGLQEKQPDLRDSDFLFDADFEAFLP